MRKKINILLFIETGGPGGAERVLFNIAREIDRDIFNPLVCLPRKGWLYYKLAEEKIKTFIIKSNLKKFDFLWSLRLARLILEKKVDILHSHLLDANFYGSIASLFTKTPHVATEHGNIHYLNLNKKVVFKYLFINKFSEKIVAVSNFTAQKLKKIIKNGKKISVIYNGIDLTPFNRKESREKILQKIGINKKDAVIAICVANYYAIKGHRFLIDAFYSIKNKIPNLYILCFGKGDLMEKLIKKVKDLKIEDRFLIMGFRDNIYKILMASDIFVLPSLSEAFPISILEAMGAGLPVIATEVGGIPEIIENGKSGFIIRPKDVDELADKIFILAKDKNLRENMGQYSKNLVQKKFDIKLMISSYQNIYKSLVK